MSRGCWMARVTTPLVISLKVTRRVLSSGSFSSSLMCQEMASPSRSGSVARYTVSALSAAFFSSRISSAFSFMGMYSGAKSCSRSTPMVLLGRSRRWPMQALTW